MDVKVGISHDVAAGMSFLHALNVIHRDLKPGRPLCFVVVLDSSVSSTPARHRQRIAGRTTAWQDL